MDFASSAATAVRDAADHTAIRAVIDLYFYGLDGRDRAALAACFTKDAHVRYQIGTELEFTRDGNEVIASHFHGSMMRQTVTTHMGASVVIAIDGDRARAVTNAMANVIQGDRALIRGLRYEDELVREGGGWRIAERRHYPLWQHEAEARKPVIPGYAESLKASAKS